MTGNDYHLVDPNGSGSGGVVVNGTEIDFFNGSSCDMPLPAGIGRYRWTISASVLRFTDLNSDPCPRGYYLSGPKGWQKLP